MSHQAEDAAFEMLLPIEILVFKDNTNPSHLGTIHSTYIAQAALVPLSENQCTIENKGPALRQASCQECTIH